jgi:hypothetical protein
MMRLGRDQGRLLDLVERMGIIQSNQPANQETPGRRNTNRPGDRR